MVVSIFSGKKGGRLWRQIYKEQYNEEEEPPHPKKNSAQICQFHVDYTHCAMSAKSV